MITKTDLMLRIIDLEMISNQMDDEISALSARIEKLEKAKKTTKKAKK